MKLELPRSLLSFTLTSLSGDGALGRESVMLWLGRRSASRIVVVEAFRPEQWARADVFRIPQQSMAAIMQRLRERDLMIAAQIHTHPAEAFHSAADDAWAIVRHEGAVSIVLPRFARAVTPNSFFRDAATYVCSDRGSWRQAELSSLVELVS